MDSLLRRVTMSEHQEVTDYRKTGYQEVTGYDVWVSRNQEVRESGRQEVKASGRHTFRKSGS